MAERTKAASFPRATGSAGRARRFYVKALSVAERAALEEALHVDGIDEEIALLRVRLLQAVKKTPEDIDLMFRGAALLSRLVVTKYGLQKGDAGDIQEAIRRAVASLKEIGREDADE